MIQRYNEQGKPDLEGVYVLNTDHEDMVKSILEREAATHERHDKRFDELEAAAAEGLKNKQIADYVATVPTAHWLLRLPIIRHFRAGYHLAQVNRHYDWYLSMGQLPVNAHLDYGVVEAIKRGDK